MNSPNEPDGAHLEDLVDAVGDIAEALLPLALTVDHRTAFQELTLVVSGQEGDPFSEPILKELAAILRPAAQELITASPNLARKYVHLRHASDPGVDDIGLMHDMLEAMGDWKKLKGDITDLNVTELGKNRAKLEKSNDRLADVAKDLTLSGDDPVALATAALAHGCRQILDRTVRPSDIGDGKQAVRDIMNLFRSVFTTLKTIGRYRDNIQTAGDPGRHGRKPQPGNLRSWTQHDLDDAIRKYKAERAKRYSELVEARREDRKGSLKAARKLFGRNTIARALGVKSKSQVSKSPPWVAMAKELRLPLARDRVTGTNRTAKKQRVGLGIADKEKSTSDWRQSEAEAKQARAYEEDTEGIIRQLPPQQAEPILEKLQAGEITDDQARGQVEVLKGGHQ